MKKNRSRAPGASVRGTAEYPVESFFMWQGRWLSKLSRHDEDIESYRLVTDLEPKHADAYHELGCPYAELGRYKELAPHTNVK